MIRKAFKFKLNPGQKEEYKKRHEELWPELENLLKSAGIQDYSIFFDEATDSLFGILSIENPENLDDLPKHPIMQKWWDYMADIMEVNSDNSPKSIDLEKVFYMK
ncbi:MAG: L-rhamnose mutarotase [Bacteroidota bacterium]